MRSAPSCHGKPHSQTRSSSTVMQDQLPRLWSQPGHSGFRSDTSLCISLRGLLATRSRSVTEIAVTLQIFVQKKSSFPAAPLSRKQTEREGGSAGSGAWAAGSLGSGGYPDFWGLSVFLVSGRQDAITCTIRPGPLPGWRMPWVVTSDSITTWVVRDTNRNAMHMPCRQAERLWWRSEQWRCLLTPAWASTQLHRRPAGTQKLADSRTWRAT